jgi:uncharacterized membrane protein
MRLKRSEPQMRNSLLLAFLIVSALLAGCSPLVPPDGLSVQKVDEEQFALEIFDNSPTFSQALAINAAGQLIGFREVVDETGTVFAQEPFFIDGQQTTRVPLLDGYTNIELLALSDKGQVVGYASRPMGHAEGSLTGFVWDSNTGTMTQLKAAEGDISCHAQSISADGMTISGYSVGAGPPRMRPCVWTWSEADSTWQTATLETLDDYNPYMMSSSVQISPDGQRIAACITVARLPNDTYDSSLYQWQRVEGKWMRELVSDEQMYLCDMNDAGQIAGIITTEGGRMPCHVDASGQVTLIDLLPGDVMAEARGINAAGTIVGFSDDPPGPQGGPQAFVWRQGTTSPMELPAGTTASAAFGINDQGQIAGLLDVPKVEVVAVEDTAAGTEVDEETLVQTLAFRWTPKGKGSLAK